jgi:hypothetical protein
VYWMGSGFEDVIGGKEDTRTVGETRKLAPHQLIIDKRSFWQDIPTIETQT